jgi:Ca2+-binding EF-hand superfamily protein
MFEQSQIAEFKEAFGLLERGDGFIDKEDLRDMLNSLGLIIF